MSRCVLVLPAIADEAKLEGGKRLQGTGCCADASLKPGWVQLGACSVAPFEAFPKTVCFERRRKGLAENGTETGCSGAPLPKTECSDAYGA
jgi:hypothetical protein